MLLRNIHLWIKTGTTPTQKGQETDHPFRKSSILCCSVIKFLEPRVIQFRAMKETNIKNLCFSRIIKYFLLLKNHYFYFVLCIGTNKNISMHLPCSGMTQKVQTVQGEQVLLKLGIWRVFPICFAVVPCILQLCFLCSRCAKTMYYSYIQFRWCANEMAVVLCILQLYIQFVSCELFSQLYDIFPCLHAPPTGVEGTGGGSLDLSSGLTLDLRLM